jgi:cell division protein DivIC
MMKKYLLTFFKRYRKYVVIATAFVIWMVFFDNRNVFVQHRLDSQIKHLQTEYSSYQQKLEEVKSEYNAMRLDPEKYAREKYFMHKPTEEVFIYRQENRVNN